MITLAACSRNSTQTAAPFSHQSRSITPSWLQQIPQGEYMLGISYPDLHFPERATEQAKEFAAIALSRNHSSYIVDKEALLTLADHRDIDYNSKRFDLVVSADMDYLNYAIRELKPVLSYSADGLEFVLFGINSKPFNTLALGEDATLTPSWAAKPALILDKDIVISTAQAREAELQDAFLAAQEIALRQIGQYRVQNVASVVRDWGDVHLRQMSMETVTINSAARLKRAHFVAHEYGFTRSYTVYLQLEAHP
jgi:hypothetical protein